MTAGDPRLSGSGETDVGSVFISNYPPYSAWSPAEVPHARRILSRPPEAETPLGLYLHIPFCRKRCKFCYFKVYTEMDSAQVRAYLSALSREVRMLSNCPVVAGRPLSFVYFGGGTPSFVSVRDMRRLEAELKAAIPWTGAREVTFECEPGTLTRPKVEAIRAMGVTRLSLGVENFSDSILRENGRAHVSAEIDRVLPWIRAQAFDQLNIDLIAGMVGETWESWRQTVRRTIDAGADSVTIYQMELPYNTVYSKDLLAGDGGPRVAGWDLKRAWHDHAIEALESAGYEISSAYTMIRKGSGARFVYRDSVWHGCDLLGAGVASFSHVGGIHYQNESEWGPYISRLESGEIPIARALATTSGQRAVREMILQLKLGRLEAAPFARKFGRDVLAEHAGTFRRLEAEGMLVVRPGGVELTRKGLLRVDHLLPAFYAGEYHGARYT
ncbi:MAG TPA: coproporphyrinogen-III oxidase family protein [Candidatus Polarisedimenticolia bacterium]|nr:coproporphyrinogen-III oxidase family protein [Candidatus Polarisedimenticolia bacterium]